MKRLWYVAIGMAAVALVGCSSTVSGIVRDKPTGNPIASAMVTIDKQAAVTNAMGVYELSVSAEPSSIIFVNAPGYNLYTESLGDRLIHDIELVPRHGN